MVNRLLETIGFSANHCLVSNNVIKLLKTLTTDNTSYLSWLPKEIFNLVEKRLRLYLEFKKLNKMLLFRLMEKFKDNKYMLIVNNDNDDIFILKFDEEHEREAKEKDEDEGEDKEKEEKENKIRNQIYSYKYFLIQSKTISYKTYDNMEIVIDNIDNDILSINIRHDKDCECCNSTPLKISCKDTTIYFVRPANIATHKKNNAELLHNIIIRNLR